MEKKATPTLAARFYRSDVGGEPVRKLPHRKLSAGGGQAQHVGARGGDELRDVPQVDLDVVVCEGRSQHLQRGDQLRGLPQRQRWRDRQAGDPHSHGRGELRQLPQRERLGAIEVEPHAGDGDEPVRELPQRWVPASRCEAVQSHSLPIDRGGGER